jgi:hypothetical protein
VRAAAALLAALALAACAGGGGSEGPATGDGTPRPAGAVVCAPGACINPTAAAGSDNAFDD